MSRIHLILLALAAGCLLTSGCTTRTKSVQQTTITGRIGDQPVVINLEGVEASEEVTRVDINGVIQAAVAAAKGDFAGALEAIQKDNESTIADLRAQLGDMRSAHESNLDKINNSIDTVQSGQMDLGKLVEGGLAAWNESKDDIHTLQEITADIKENGGKIDAGHVAGGGGALGGIAMLVWQIIARRKREQELEDERRAERERAERAEHEARELALHMPPPPQGTRA